jgi:PAS domain S-box-containing protein
MKAMKAILVSVVHSRATGYLAAVLGIATVIAIGVPFRDQLNNTTVALALLLVVLFVATGWGRGPGMVAAVLGMLCFNFFFLPPVYTFTIADPQNWVALAAFSITASIAGHLSVTAKRRAAEAEAGRKAARSASAYNRSLIEASLDPLVTIGHDGKITDVNTATETVTGYARAELIGTDFSDYFSEPDKARAGYQQAFQEGLIRDYTLEIRRRDGHKIPVLYNASVYRDETGDVVGVFAAARDITERKHAESEISLLARLQSVVAELGQRALHSDRYESVLEEAVRLVAQTLDVEYCNVMEMLPGGEELLLRAGVGWKEGYVGRATVNSRDSQPGYTVCSDRPVIVDDAATETRFIPLSRLLGENVVSAMSVVISTREGAYGALGAHTRRRRTFTKDEVNFLQAVANVLGATIERRRAEAALRESEANLNRAQEIAHIGSWHLDVPRNRLTWSDEVFRIFGVPNGVALTYETFLATVHPEDRASVDQAWTAALHGALYDIEHRIVVGGGLKWVRERAQVEFDPDGNAVEGIGTVQDVTERKRAEDELRMLARLQAEVAELGERALRGALLSDVLDEAVTQVVRALNVNYCKVMELLPSRQALLLRHGVGWKPGYVGQVTVGLGTESQAGYTLLVNEPVVVEDLRTEKRFAGTSLLYEHDVVSGISVIISTKEGPYGVLGVHTRHYRIFTRDEINFLQAVANILGSAIERYQAETQLRRLNRTNRALSRCNEALVRATDESTLLQQVCDLIIEEAGHRLCWVGLAEHDEAKSVRPAAQAGFEAGYLDTLQLTWADAERGRGPTGTCIRTRQPVLSKHIATDPTMLPWRAEALKRGYASSIAIPLSADSVAFGAINIYAPEPEAFGPEEVKLLTELADDLAFGITTLRTRMERARAEVALRETEKREEARKREIEIGFKIQQMLLLNEPPRDVPGLGVAALTIPSQRIDGDFYDFFTHENQCLDVIVADVMGKGVPAALLGAAAKSQFREALSHLIALSEHGKLPEPKEIVTLAHAEMVQQLITLESFVTLCYGRLDLSRHRLDLVDCGHTGVMHLHAQTGLCDMVHGGNLPLGIRAGEIYDQLPVPFEPADVLLFYSDGVTEARNAVGELFGVERLAECVRINRDLAPEALVEAIRQAVCTFAESDQLTDDLTCVAIKVE